MSKRASRMTFRGASLALAVLAATVMVGHSGAALAGTKQVAGTHSASEIKGSCDKAGGVYFSGSEGYSCVAAGGEVDCNKNGKCTGDCKTCGPAVAKGGTGSVNGILSGTTLKASTGTSTKATAQPVRVRQPVGDTNKVGMGDSGDHHNKK